MRPAILLLTLMLVLYSGALLSVGQAQAGSLVVRVFDLHGNPRPGVELTLANSTFTRMFETTAQGVAEFRLISPGTYNLSARVEGVVVASATVTYPSQAILNLTLMIQDIELTVYDLDGRPAGGMTIELRSENGPVIRRGSTDNSGRFSIRDLPFSNLSQVGPYRVLGRLGNITVLNSTIIVSQQVSRYELTAEVVRVGISVLDYRGRGVNATLRISAEGLNYSTTLAAGRVSSLPSSSVAGAYVIEAVRQYTPQGPEISLLREVTRLDRSQNLTYVLDLSDITVVVRDDSGEALQGVRILLESERLGVLGSSTTGRTGLVAFEAIPFSEGRPGAGLYHVTVYKDSIRLSVLDINLVPGTIRVNMTVNRLQTVFYIHKPSGQPLANASLTLLDPVTRRTYTAASDANGRVTLSLIPGTHQYAISYMGVEVARGVLNATEPQVSIPATNVDLELRVRVRDWAGNVLRDAIVSIVWRGRELEVVKQDDGSVSALVPVADEVRVDVYLGGSLMERRIIWVSSPTLHEVRLRGVMVGGGLVDVETITSIVASVLLALSAASIAVLWRYRAPKK